MSWLLAIEIAIKSFLVGGSTLLLLRVLANRSASERSWIAHCGLFVTMLLPVIAVLPRGWAMVAQFPFSLPSTVDVRSIVDGTLAPVPADLFSLESFAAGAWALYAIPAALLIISTLFAVGRLTVLRARATVLMEQPWLVALAQAQRRMGFKGGAALLVSRELQSPASWGFFRPTIVLSEHSISIAGDAEAIIAHELAHIARHDWLKLLLARAATAMFWFNPLVWLLARRADELREEAADDAVLHQKVDPVGYATLLLETARSMTRTPNLAANGVAPRRGSLKRRVGRVLDARLARAPASLRWIGTCLIVAVLFVGPLAAVTLARGENSIEQAAPGGKTMHPESPSPMPVPQEAGHASFRQLTLPAAGPSNEEQRAASATQAGADADHELAAASSGLDAQSPAAVYQSDAQIAAGRLPLPRRVRNYAGAQVVASALQSDADAALAAKAIEGEQRTHKERVRE